jgi:CheY-like chemotaxis protein
MSDLKARLLIVDDDASVRQSLSSVLVELGYAVRMAEDGFSALTAMCQETPDILLTDLNMPGASGFELLGLVSRWFPEVGTVAMSGAFSGTEVPSGVAADAFYQKGSSLGALVRILESLPKAVRLLPYPEEGAEPKHRLKARVKAQETTHALCPVCRQTFLQFLAGEQYQIRPKACAGCASPVSYTVESAEQTGSPSHSPRRQNARWPAARRAKFLN